MKKNLERIKTEVAESAVETVGEITTNEVKENLAYLLGAMGAMETISLNMNSALIKGLQKIRDEQLYEHAGFDRFDTFLDEYKFSPMKYKKFNYLEGQFKKEGEQIFDLLNGLAVPMSKRKLLGAGNVQIEGEMLIVKSIVGEGFAEKTETIELSNRTRILQVVSALADQAAALNVSNRKQKETIDRGEKEIGKLQKQIDEGIGGKGNASEFDSFMRIVAESDALAAKVKKEFTIVEREAHSEVYLDAIFASFLRLRAAYGRTDLTFSTHSAANPNRKPLGEMNESETENHVAKKMKTYKGDEADENDFAAITKDLNDEELEELL